MTSSHSFIQRQRNSAAHVLAQGAIWVASGLTLGCSDDSSESRPTPAASNPSRPDSTRSADGGLAADSRFHDAFAECTRGKLPNDFVVIDGQGQPQQPRWYGAGADPDTGALLPSDGEYWVSATYLALKPEPEVFQKFGELQPALSQALFGNPGMVAVQLGSSDSCATARTLTVWRDEAAMMQFVGSPAHLDAIAAFPSLSRGGATLAAWGGVKIKDVDWDAALGRLAAEQTYD